MQNKLWIVLVFSAFTFNSHAKTSMRHPEKKAALVGAMLLDGNTGTECLVDHENYDLQSPAFGKRLAISYEASEVVFGEVPSCAEEDNEWAEASAAVSYPTERGPEIAGLFMVAVGYYLICSASNTNTARMHQHIDSGKDNYQVQISKYITTGIDWSICSPATGINKAIVYFFSP